MLNEATVIRKDNTLLIEGHVFPYKGIPTEEAVQAASKVKRKLLKLQVDTETLAKHIPTYPLTKAAQTVYELVSTWCVKLGRPNDKFAHTIALIFEYDQAYRFRLQDLMRKTDSELMSKQPRREINKLFRYWKARDKNELLHKTISRKFTFLFFLARTLLIVPKYRRILKETLKEIPLENLYPDDNDLYWMYQKMDYDYEGLSYQDRMLNLIFDRMVLDNKGINELTI